MCGSRTVHPLLLGEFLGSMLLDCLVRNLCIVHLLLFFGEFLLPLYFRETLFLVHTILLPLFTWAFCSFSFRVSSVCQSCTFFVGASLSFAQFSWGVTAKM